MVVCVSYRYVGHLLRLAVPYSASLHELHCPDLLNKHFFEHILMWEQAVHIPSTAKVKLNIEGSDQNGLSLIYIMLEIHHTGREPSIFE